MEAPHFTSAVASIAQSPSLIEEKIATPIPIQPQPALTRIVHFRLFRWWITAIMRHWEPGESGPGGRCRLCPKCKAYKGGCLIVVNGRINPESADLFSIHDRRIS